MGYPALIVDPNISLAHIIILVTLVIAAWKWLRHEPTTSDDAAPPHRPILLMVFRFLLLAIYPVCLGFTLAAAYPILIAMEWVTLPLEELVKNQYITQSNLTVTLKLTILQALSTLMACLYLLYSNHHRRFDGLIAGGLVLLCLNTLRHSIQQYQDYPFRHWIQVAEFALSTLSLLLIPLCGLLIFIWLRPVSIGRFR